MAGGDAVEQALGGPRKSRRGSVVEQPDLLAGLWQEAPFARLPDDAPPELQALVQDIENPRRVYAIHKASRRHDFQFFVDRFVETRRAAPPRPDADAGQICASAPHRLRLPPLLDGDLFYVPEAACRQGAHSTIQSHEREDAGRLPRKPGQPRQRPLSVPASVARAAAGCQQPHLCRPLSFRVAAAPRRPCRPCVHTRQGDRQVRPGAGADAMAHAGFVLGPHAQRRQC